MEVCRLAPGRLVFVDEMGTHTSLALLYAYAPVGERVFFKIPRNRVPRTQRCLRALTKEGWDLRWLWKGRLPPESSKHT
jgi:hypothetical protein